MFVVSVGLRYFSVGVLRGRVEFWRGEERTGW